MTNIANIASSRREQFLLDRKAGIGGSDVAAIMGLSPFKTALDVYRDKTSYVDVMDAEELSEDLRRGNRAEEYILKQYAENTGETLECNLPKLVDNTYPFMIGHIDARVKGQNVIVEAKSTKLSLKSWCNELPKYYQPQVAYYASLFDADRVDVPVLFSGWEYGCFTYWRNYDLEEEIRKCVIKFWNDHVLAGVPPAPQNLEELKQAYPFLEAQKVLEANEEIMRVIEELDRASAARKQLEQQEGALKLRIQEYMGDASVLDAGRFKVTLKDSSISRVDVAALKSNNPDIYRTYLKTTESRTLRLIG